MVRIYLPPDAATAVSVMAHCLRSKNYVNLVSDRSHIVCSLEFSCLASRTRSEQIIGSKADGKSYLDRDETERHCVAGLSVWKKYSTDGGERPDVVLVGIGVETTAEVIVSAPRPVSCFVKSDLSVLAAGGCDTFEEGKYPSSRD